MSNEFFMKDTVKRGGVSILLGAMLFDCCLIKADPVQTSSRPERKIALDEVRNSSPRQIFGHEILQSPPESPSQPFAAYIVKKKGEYQKQFLVIQSDASRERIYGLSYPPGYGEIESVVYVRAFFFKKLQKCLIKFQESMLTT